MRWSSNAMAPVLFASMAVVLAGVVVFTNRNDLTSAVLLLSGIGCFIVAIVSLAFSGERGVDPELASLATVGGVIDTAILCADLGLQQNARFVPTPKGVVQCIPAGEALPDLGGDPEWAFLQDEEGCGVLLPPSSAPLLSHLKERHHLLVPAERDGVVAAIREVLVEMLQRAERVEAIDQGERMLITLSGIRGWMGCLEMQRHSPKCCTLVPCAICSLIASLVAEGLQKTVSLERVQLEPERERVRITLLLHGQTDPQLSGRNH